MAAVHLPYEVDPARNRFHYYENHWKEVGLDLLVKHCQPAGKTLLDYGCGRGEALALASQRGFVAAGTDADPECVKLSARHGQASVLRVEDPLGQFGEKSFDVVACFHVLEHVDNPKHVLQTLAAIARSFVLIAVPNLRYLHRLFERRFDLSQINEGHLQSWDHWHLRNLAERHCGLTWVAWASDATILPVLSNVALKVLGHKATIRLETGLFRRWFPYHCLSVLGLFSVPQTNGS